MKTFVALIGGLLAIGIVGNVVNYQRRVADTEKVEKSAREWDELYQKGMQEADEEYRRTLRQMNLTPEEKRLEVEEAQLKELREIKERLKK